MIEIYHETGGPVIGVAETPEETIPQKGVVAPTSRNGRVYEISGLVEKPSIEEAPSNLAVVGRYVLPPEIFCRAGANESRSGRRNLAGRRDRGAARYAQGDGVPVSR